MGIATLLVVCLLSACKEDIDMSNRYTFTEYTVLSYLEEHPQYSEYVNLLDKVRVSEVSESSVAQLLSARGHFTCFAPNNDAIQEYLDTLQRKGIIDKASWDGFRDETTLDSIRKVIVYNSIIDGGDVEYYETATFPTHDNDEFSIANMNDRKLSVVRGKINPDSIFINGEYPISMQHRDIEAINGRVHEMTQVIAPSNDSMADFLRLWATEGGTNYTVMAKLILACGLADTLSKIRDEVYEMMWLRNQIEDIGNFKTNTESGLPSEHRKYGFTIFAETDATWEAALAEVGITKSAAEITAEDVVSYLEQKDAYPKATKDANYKDENNILNQFVTYHILPERMSRDKLVIHYNEKGYNYASSRNYTVATEEFYTTMGKRRLLKLFQSFESKGIYLNRFPVLRNGRGRFSAENMPEDNTRSNYHENGDFKPLRGIAMRDTENEGIKVEEDADGNGTVESAINGIVYPITNVLVYSENVQAQLKNQRIRMDLSSILPEMINNDLRRPMVNYPTRNGAYRGFPPSSNYQYFEDIDIKDGTRFYYLTGLGSNWMNWQGDEYNIKGRYEFTLRLPPVPAEGHYELRLSVQSNSNLRGMCQVYWGPDKKNLPAVGIPFDMRMGGLQRHLTNSNQESIVGWVADADLADDEAKDEVDKKMRNNGFMKAPEHFCPTPGGGTARQQADVNRRILVSADMSPDKVYYIKFKSVLDDVEKEHIIDYIEYCAKEVYDNPNEREDIF